MSNIYLSFLSSPTASALAPNAALHYITTTTSIQEPEAIIKHLQAQDKVVKKKAETILNVITTDNAIVVETETSLEFVRGGGTFLPNMDDNMLVDSLATIPIVHIVQLNSSGKISQIRMHWDQSTMLKQVDAIGRTGRNWPIRDGPIMAKLIKSSVAAVGSSPAPRAAPVAAAKRNEVVITDRPNSREKENKDYHTRLFATGDDAEPRSPSDGDAVAVRTSAKPAARQWGELFVDEGQRQDPSTTKVEGTRIGAGKNFSQNRLFDENTANENMQSPNSKKSDPEKYNHFEFGNGEEAPPRDGNRPPSANAKKHMNNWDFQDFSTPPKHNPKPLMEQQRHFGYGIDEDQPPSPVKRPVVHAPRPDAHSQFAITDDASPPVNRQQPKTTRPDALASHLKTENGMLTADDGTKRIPSMGGIRRGPDINTHYTSTDASPGASHDENARLDDTRQGGRNAKSKSRNDNDQPHWRMEDESPEKPKKIYKTAGDGMGGRASAGRSWGIGDEDQPDEPVKQPKIYKTYGNGMGGRNDALPTWSWGDRDDEVEDPSSGRPKLAPARRMSSPRKRPRKASETDTLKVSPPDKERNVLDRRPEQHETMRAQLGNAPV